MYMCIIRSSFLVIADGISRKRTNFEHFAHPQHTHRERHPMRVSEEPESSPKNFLIDSILNAVVVN